MTLGDDELARYARHIILKEVGGTGQLRLKAATVAVVGVGGIGSPAVQYLAGAGVGRLVLIDDDRVDASNLQRQTLFATAEVGARKVDAAGTWVAAHNPYVAVLPHAVRLEASNSNELLASADVVLDGCDDFASRHVVAATALATRVPLVSAAVGEWQAQLGVFRGWEPNKPCYRCFVGDDPARAEVSCADAGILGPVTGMIGSLAALEAIRAIVPFGEDSAGKLLLADLLTLRLRTLVLPKDPGCPACGLAAL